MPKFKFTNFYKLGELPPDEVIIEAENEDAAYAIFDEKYIQPIADSFICEEESNEI